LLTGLNILKRAAMTIPSASQSISNEKSLEKAFKQFSLETEHLEMTYAGLKEQFKNVELSLQDSHLRLNGKLAELGAISRYLETILHSISQGIIFINLQKVVTTYNIAAQKILNIPEKELLYHPFSNFFDDQFLGFSLEKTFATQQCPPITTISYQLDGEKKELEIETTFVHADLQAHSIEQRKNSLFPMQGLLILMRDVTTIRRLQQLTNQQDRLKELGGLAAHLAHEIRNPLGGIKGFASILAEELKEQPQLHQMACYIIQGVEGLNQFVTRILLFARPFQPCLEKVDLVQFIGNLYELIQIDPVWNPRIRFTIHTSVPSILLSIDPHLLQSALFNLCLNAIQAMPDGGELTISMQVEGDWVVIELKDTGQGIAKENLSKIFSPFFTTKENGNGLGLAEVQKVIQGHYGWIDVHSEQAQGTTFTIKIPLRIRE
jgi:signal transduction histidine kinase